MASSDDRWRDMDITKDEVDKIGKALKDETFRKMFVEYAEEIADPKNRELYEKEIAQMEAERGMDVQFIHPKPGHVLKVLATAAGSNGSSKIFINVCQNEFIAPPSHEKKKQANGKIGLQWSIPHSFSPAREDLDKSGNKCSVYDVVFHPDTYKMSTNAGFLKMLHDTALEGLERQFGLSIDRNSLVKLKHLTFKGRVEPTIMRKKKQESDSQSEGANKENDPLPSFPYPYEKGVSSEELAQKKAKQVEEDKKRRESRQQVKQQQPKGEKEKDGVVTPEYTLVNRYGVDMADYSQSLTGTPLTGNHIPSELVVSIHLPRLSSAAPCNLDVTEYNLTLETTQPVVYRLSIKLPHPVDDENGSAKFDKAKKMLVVTLPVFKDKVRKALEEATFKSFHSNNNNEDDNQHKPLIEEMLPESSPSTESDIQNDIKDSESNPPAAIDSMSHAVSDDKDVMLTIDDRTSPALCLDKKVSYKLPKFSSEQDEDAVTLVVEVARIKPQTYKSAYHENTVEIAFSTSSPSGFPTNYYLKCIFPHPVTTVSKDLGDTNMVLTINKTTGAFWDSFLFGGSDDGADMQERKFLSRSEMLQELEQMKCDEGAHEGKTSSAMENGQVVGDQNNSSGVQSVGKELTLDLKGLKGSKESAPPVVVHKHSPPDIPGILKRTLSESSADDHAHSHDVGGGDQHNGSEDSGSSTADLQPSPRERKKSVSFSDKVEETTFKSKDSVCHMHKTLLNRRKKQRQRETRKESRIRRNSSADCTSSDDQNSKKVNGGGSRRRRNSSCSSTTSDDNALSPRSPVTLADPGSQVTQTCSCPDQEGGGEPQATSPGGHTAQSNNMVLNSDDDDEEDGFHEKQPSADGEAAKENNSVTSWADGSEFVEKTKCAFDFNNSVIFDLDE